MPQLPLTRKELRRRYRQGERDFSGVDLSGASLRGMDLQGIELSGADLRGADLRGTRLDGATLMQTALQEAVTGARRWWLVFKLVVTAVSLGLSVFLTTAFYVLSSAFLTESGNSFKQVDITHISIELAGLAFILAMVGGIYARGMLVGIRVATFAFAFAAAFATAGIISRTIASAGVGRFSVFIAIAFALALVLALASAFAFASALTFAVAGTFALALTFALAVAGTFAVVFIMVGADPRPIALIIVFSICNIIIDLLVSRRALNGDPRDRLIRDVAVWFGSLGGTSFRNADLTDADFTEATLKNANFTGATLTRTSFHLSQKLNLARLGKTILTDYAILTLLTTHRGSGQDYTGKSLKGANIAGADLTDAIFTEADLSQADLTGASLSRATLTKTQALGTQFRQADLTGACLEAWNIDSTTQLDGAVCEHVYLLRNQQERRPSSGTFQPGEFTKLFQEVLNTVDLIFRDGLDWKAFVQTLDQVQVEHQGANLGIQAIENKGDGVVVVKLNAAPTADKAAIHQRFQQQYQKQLKAVKQRYQKQLKAMERDYQTNIQHKDQLIQLHQQQSADLRNIVEIQAQQPITVHNTSTAMQGNDQSQNFQGDVSINAQSSVVNLRDISGQVTNQIQQLPDSSPDQPSLKALLAQLKTAIDADDIADETKADALAEVSELAAAGQAPQQPAAQKTAKRSLNALKGIVSGLSDASKLAIACEKLLPLIMGAFAL